MSGDDSHLNGGKSLRQAIQRIIENLFYVTKLHFNHPCK